MLNEQDMTRLKTYIPEMSKEVEAFIQKYMSGFYGNIDFDGDGTVFFEQSDAYVLKYKEVEVLLEVTIQNGDAQVYFINHYSGDTEISIVGGVIPKDLQVWTIEKVY